MADDLDITDILRRLEALEAADERRRRASATANAEKQRKQTQRRQRVAVLGARYGWLSGHPRLSSEAICQKIAEDLHDEASGKGPTSRTIRDDLHATLGPPGTVAVGNSLKNRSVLQTAITVSS